MLQRYPRRDLNPRNPHITHVFFVFARSFSRRETSYAHEYSNEGTGTSFPGINTVLALAARTTDNSHLAHFFLHASFIFDWRRRRASLTLVVVSNVRFASRSRRSFLLLDRIFAIPRAQREIERDGSVIRASFFPPPPLSTEIPRLEFYNPPDNFSREAHLMSRVFIPGLLIIDIF